MEAKLSIDDKDEAKYFYRLGASVKTLSDQYKVSQSTIYGLFIRKEKRNARRRIYYKNNPTKIKLLAKKWRESEKGKAKKQRASFNALYHLTVEAYKEKLVEQNFLYGICRKPQTLFRKQFCVDHNHMTGKIRGLLCSSCNLKLVAIENKDFCLAATLYLQRYR